MQEHIASLRKMSVSLKNPVEYTLSLNDKNILLNTLLGKKIQFRYTGEIRCIQCDRKTSKSFQQGYCFPCYRRLLECNLCIIHPEKCRYYEGVCQSDDWAHQHCTQPHVVYLANSSGLKVGITRSHHSSSRWIDQGATQGLLLFKVANRHQAGLMEVLLKNFVADKTNWQKMLKGNNHTLDLLKKRDEILAQGKSGVTHLIKHFKEEIQLVTDATVTKINYPVLQYPQKIKTFDLDKNPAVEGILQGIKGQYLILDTGVISIRKFGGYKVAWECLDVSEGVGPPALSE